MQYILYQHRVRSGFPLWGVPDSGSEFDFEFVRADAHMGRPFTPDTSHLRYKNPAAGVELYEHESIYCLRYPGVADYFITDGKRVVVHVEPGASEMLVVSLLHGPVSAFLLELRGTLCLHASAVQIGERAVGFLGRTGAGKSTIAMHFVSRGIPLVTDDILPLILDGNVCCALPGYPRIKLRAGTSTDDRMDPDLGKTLQVVGSESGGVGSFVTGSCPLSVLYVLDRGPSSETPAMIEQLGPSDGFAEVLRYSFCARVIGAVNREAIRFGQLARLTQHLSIQRLRLPNGVKSLSDSCDRVLADHMRCN